MKKICRIFILCVLLIQMSSCASNKEQKESEAYFKKEELIELYSNTWRIVKDYYGYSDEIQVDWDVSYQEHLAQALDAADAYAQWEIYESFLADISDGHLSIQSSWLPDCAGSLPVSFTWIEDAYYVTAKSRNEDIPLMSRLLAIEGEEPLSYVKKQYEGHIMPCSDSQINDAYIDRFSYNRKGEKVTLTFADAQGNEIEKTYGYDLSYGSTFSQTQEYLFHTDDSVVMKQLGGGDPVWYYAMGNDILYVYIENFNAGTAQMIEKILKEYPLEEYKYILDVRGNRGGNGSESLKVLELLTGNKMPSPAEQYKVNNAYYVRERYSVKPGNTDETIMGEKMYEGNYYEYEEEWAKEEITKCKSENILILANRDTVSAGEFFVIAANEIGFTTMGENTHGMIGGSVGIFPVTDNVSLMLSVGRAFDLEGNPLFHAAADPKITIIQSAEDAKNGIDTVLMSSYKELEKK